MNTASLMPPMRPTWLVAAGALAFTLASPAFAHDPLVYTADLLGVNEIPSVNSPGHGRATLTLDEDAMTLRVQASFSDLVGNTTAAHVHCCTTQPGTGNAGVATPVPTFPGFPSGVKAGSYDQTFDLSLASNWNTAFINLNGGTVTSAFEAFSTALSQRKAYFNVHTSAFASGEIRGTLTPVPEPSSFAMLGAGLAVAAVALRRGRRQPGSTAP